MKKCPVESKVLLVAVDSDGWWCWPAESGWQEAREDIGLLLLGRLEVGLVKRQTVGHNWCRLHSLAAICRRLFRDGLCV